MRKRLLHRNARFGSCFAILCCAVQQPFRFHQDAPHGFAAVSGKAVKGFSKGIFPAPFLRRQTGFAAKQFGKIRIITVTYFIRNRIHRQLSLG